MTGPVAYISPADTASDALSLAFADPHRALPVAQRALAAARAAGDGRAMSLAEQALGISARLLGDIATSIVRLRAAVRVAERHGLPERAAEARLSLALALAWAGKTQAALDSLERSELTLRGPQLAQLRVQRAVIARRLGKHDQALEEIRKALPVLRRHGDTLWEARALCHRGLSNVDRGAFTLADADLARAEALFRSLGSSRDAAANRHNRGWCAARAGDVPTALEHYDAAEQEWAELGLALGEVLLDRARVVLSAGLTEEALVLATRAEARCGDDRVSAAEALLTRAEAALQKGDAVSARATAADAARRFARQGRPGWVALAHQTQVRAAWAAGERSPALLRVALRAAGELDRVGLPGPAGEARLIAGRTAVELGRTIVGRRCLEEASRVRHRGPAAQRARGWLAEALLRLAAGETAAAQRALRAGLRLLDEHRTSLGATELQAHASNAGSDLADVGLRLAFASGRADQVLTWTERWRAVALRLRPVLPPDDAELASDLAGLRKVVSEVEAAATSGRPTRSLLRRQAELEEAVRRRTRRAVGDGEGSGDVPSVEELAGLVDDGSLAEITEFDGQLYATVVTRHGCWLQRLGALAEVLSEMEMARFGLRRLAHGQGPSASLDASASAVAHAGRQLEDLLLAPVRSHIGEGPLVVVPPASLHALPWGIVPSCRSRPVTVAPSAALWLRAMTATAVPAGATVFVAGPGLPGAGEELAALAELYPAATCLTGSGADAAAVGRALDGASLAHVAAHGTFRSDNPLFSSLRMSDGPFTAYDLQRMRHAPRRVVLAACDSGLSGVRPGDELMGLAAVFLQLGSASLVASVVPVPDDATSTLMISLHQNLLKGASLAAALTDAREGQEGDQRTTAAAAAFVCMGAG